MEKDNSLVKAINKNVRTSPRKLALLERKLLKMLAKL